MTLPPRRTSFRTPSAHAFRRARAGFTLLEMMAVILILALLMGFLVTQLGSTQQAANARLTQARITQIELALAEYETRTGDWPPSTFTPEQGQPPNTTNLGAECLVIALWSKGFDAGGGDFEDMLVNTDGDQSRTRLTDFGTADLFELGDAWGNPIAYLHRSDYERAWGYVTLDTETGEPIEGQVKAAVNRKLGRPHGYDRYQLVSAGGDGRFGTEDDLGSFPREDTEAP